MRQLKVFCIVVTYNGKQWIDKCFGYLLESTIPLKILCVDNGSSDDTVGYLKTNYPEVKVIDAGANLGFGKGNNIGLKIALEEEADYVFLLNQDAWIQRGCIENLLECYEQNMDIGILSPIHLNGAGNNFNTHFKEYASEDYCPGFLSDKFFGRSKPIYLTRFMNAAAWMLSVETIKKVGGFDPLFPHYGEDNDYVERAHLLGLKVFICENAFINHDAKEISNEMYSKLPERLIIHHLVRLKNVSSTYKSNWATVLKSEFDIQTTMLLFRKFDNFKSRFTGFIRTFSYFKKIKIARKKSKDSSAFLN